MLSRSLFPIFCCLILNLYVSIAFAQKAPNDVLMSVNAAGHIGGDLDEPEGDPTAIFSIDISGVETWDLLDDPDNTVLTEFVGSPNALTGVGWEVTITTVGASWLSEATIYFDGQDLDGSGLFLAPGAGFGQPGSMHFDSGGIFDLTDNGIPNIEIGIDAYLYMQFFESFDDVSDAVDAFFEDGSRIEIALLDYPGPDCLSYFCQDVPALGPFGIAALAVLLAGVGAWRLRRS